MALPEIEVDFSRRDESGRVLLDKADLSFYPGSPVGWKGFFCDGKMGAVGTIEEGPVARLWHPPFDLDITSPNIRQYMDLLKTLKDIRRQNDGADSPEEDELLEQMDVVWDKMSPEEIGAVEKRNQDDAD